ncbi:hypothetical protein CB0940_07466 [Cercospora beticola]|uniref:p-hydroxylaminobenzoate lyase n=1 Tax=Cercospora beticola TaxID=122368 RepID=A0A2G5HBG9_CERBT|nr:hypothetical protein CB0940_07466 [Cercospora beticola]PIA89592.1 hypothetical protein CB0940_07466 [Cercospora beticola]WPB03420.1 hypothetical protein RHO25_008059 [Cercospora beticola]CAK1357857.1 unnamed protein product [Cercospora beticola]
MTSNPAHCAECKVGHDGSPEGVDLITHPTAQKLAARSLEFMKEIQNLTPGKILETHLNENYGPGNPYYEDFCTLIKQGLSEGWIATHEIDGAKYRRGKIMLPSAENLWMSLTAVYFDSEKEYSGQYHKHPYGEINCVVPIDETFELEGLPEGFWMGKGWTSPGPGTHHYPRARGGKGVAFFFLPSGRISYEAKPGEPQPAIM